MGRLPGINVNAQNNKGQTPLHLAVMSRRRLPSQKDVNAQDEQGNTQLHRAIIRHCKSKSQTDYAEFMRILRLPGINVSAQNNKGETPLHLAVMGRRRLRRRLFDRYIDESERY